MTALGVVGLSFGTVFMFAYLALPVFAASRLTGGDPAAYLASGRPVLAQDTTLENICPVGTGLITFSTIDEARDGIEERVSRREREILSSVAAIRR